MLTLYIKDGCPFCRKALDAIDTLGLTVEYKNKKDAGVVDELIARGGKSQFPYLVDSDRNVEMYESDDIVRYLHETYGGGK